MSRIRILPEQLSNQIAAGEVVERPASVVKELVENSLDAGADRIEIQVEGNGTRLIRVIDNGEGMDADDVLLCLERHATSKLREEGQLTAIATLGFRGEAIPSIGSVARLTILSRTRNQEIGTKAEVRYGTLFGVHENGCSHGTLIEVQGLFANMPARKKFLKSRRTELFHIEEVLRNQALAKPEIAFTLHIDGRIRLDLPATNDIEKRIAEMYDFSGQMLAVHQHEPLLNMEVTGFLLPPDQVQPAKQKLRTLVNNRAVQDRMLRHAVVEGMRGFLMKGMQPAGVILLQLQPDQIDVNVHPAKREIRFRNSQAVHTLLTKAVAGAVLQYQQTMRESLFVSEDRSRLSVSHIAPPRQSPREIQPHGQAENTLITDHTNSAGSTETFTREPQQAYSQDSLPQKEQVANLAPANKLESQPRAAKPELGFAGLRIIGQLFSLYLLCEKDKQLVVLDQHAAHERIIYEQMRQNYAARNTPSQSLLFPAQIELSPEESELLEKNLEVVKRLGLAVSHFGEETWIIKAVPATLKNLQPLDVLQETVAALQNLTPNAPESSLPAPVDDLLAGMACKAAIKSGNKLEPEEMLALLRQMEESDVFSHCPHGRPVLKFFSQQDIEKWFKRI